MRTGPKETVAKDGGVAEFQLYGIDGSGQTGFSELLCCERAELRAVATQRLKDWSAVEVWEGPVCLLRLQRSPPCLE